MTPSPHSYAQEIRSFLLGRLEKGHDDEEVGRGSLGPMPTRWTDWWIFEGKRYAGHDGSLASSWLEVARQVLALRSAHTPRRRVVPAPEGEVDWLATIALSAVPGNRAFVARASAIGLDEAERLALEGWVGWIARRWSAYTRELGVPTGAVAELPEAFESRRGDARGDALRRFAHVARRSRWPLLRNVVAETIRCVLEPQEIDRLPLPTNRPKLFQLVCLVRALRVLHREGDRIRWLDATNGDNTLTLPGVTAVFEKHVPSEAVLASGGFPPPFVAGIRRHKLGVGGRIDLWFELSPSRGGFSSVLVECKSGGEEPETALEQLRSYYAVQRRSIAGRMLVLGVTEQATQFTQGLTVEALPSEDVVAFCTGESLRETLLTLLLKPGVAHDKSVIRAAE